MLIFSGQSICDWSSSSSAYFVTRNSHWFRSRLETAEEHRSQLPVYDLLVGQHRVARGAPVGRRVVPVGQAGLVELQEQPLVPAVVLRRRRVDLPVPVVHRAQHPQLAAHVLDVAPRPYGGVHAVLDRRVLRRQPEGVEPHGVHHVVPAHPHVPRVGVRRRHRVPVPDVQVAGRVRVHGELVPLGARVVVVHPVDPAVRPPLLPLGLDVGGVVLQVRPVHRPGRRSHLRSSCRRPGCPAATKKPAPASGTGLAEHPAVPPWLPRNAGPPRKR